MWRSTLVARNISKSRQLRLNLRSIAGLRFRKQTSTYSVVLLCVVGSVSVLP